MMSVILLQPLRSPQRGPLIDPVPAQNVIYVTQSRSFTHESNACVISRLVFLNLGFIDLLIVLAPCHPPQPRIKKSMKNASRRV